MTGPLMAATALVKLARLTGDARMTQLAEETIEQATYLMHHSPGSVCQMLIALDHLLGPSTDLVYVASTAEGKRRAVEHAFSELRPRTLIVLSILLDSGDNSLSSTRLSGLVEGRECIAGAATVLYQCSDGTCQAPIKI